jgi:hypothetical protein
VIGPMPLLPANRASQLVATELPSGDTIPSPVTTTRRLLKPLPLPGVAAMTQRAPAGVPGLVRE